MLLHGDDALLKSEKLVVGSEANQLDGVGGLVNPNQQEVVFDMTFNTSLIDSVQLVWSVRGWNLAALAQMFEHGFKRGKL